MQDLPQQLRDLRRRAGLTRAELSEQIGLSREAIAQIEVGRRETTTRVLDLWAEICGSRLVFQEAGATDSPDEPAPLDAPLDAPRQELLDTLAAALPHLPDESVRTLRAMLTGLSALYPRQLPPEAIPPVRHRTPPARRRRL